MFNPAATYRAIRSQSPVLNPFFPQGDGMDEEHYQKMLKARKRDLSLILSMLDKDDPFNVLRMFALDVLDELNEAPEKLAS